MLNFLPPNSVLLALAVILVSIGLKKETIVYALAVCGILNVTNGTIDCKLSELEAISKDPLEALKIMKACVDKVNVDEEFARNIYADCPRLQALLTKRPDIRPFFESPKFIIINFRKVYDDAIRDLVTSHALFWVFQILARIHRVVMCPIHIFKVIRACSYATTLNDERLFPIYNVASRLEDSDVRAQLHEAIAGDPTLLKRFVEAHEGLRALRDSDPLYAEMISDPEAFRIISIPENLRALCDAPELIQLDFLDSDGKQEDAEVVGRATTAKDFIGVVVVERTSAKQQNNLSELRGFVAGFMGALVVSWISSIAMRTPVMN
jgi:hypothetical protein